MKDVKVVLGANYGDEGKGLMVDYFAHQAVSEGKRVLNILTNGGPQRGHTVTTPDGKHHVFHHFGSGTFAGADTYCSDEFIVNPMEFQREANELQGKIEKLPKVYIHPRCRMTTPYDMIVNRIREDARGDERHGSCGMGIWETIQRYEYDERLTFERFLQCDRGLRKKCLESIRNYMRKQLTEYGFDELPESWREIWEAQDLIENYLAAAEYMECVCKIEQPDYTEYDVGIFENGQGLLLDESEGVHTTPSNTGLSVTNPLSWCFKVDGMIEVCYVSRTYVTRHGAGPLPGECSKAELGIENEDKTNVPNQYQGTLRYAPLDIENLHNRIQTDFDSWITKSWRCSLALTHQNEVQKDFGEFSHQYYQFYRSDGKTRKDIYEKLL